ncbi:hypothetical protein BDV26DRAFT_296710 [Aspergillus bertholletiae]|uniref:GPI anchored serine-threonine rich protein n=1 Tax=Aspergillus bertholletiae TaxID=1226010 RepID=A0A5N7AUX4_9EURO|nr:hypothetical protein BDV26DRAFT_296710 [Aspergillus bertholletiae]
MRATLFATILAGSAPLLAVAETQTAAAAATNVATEKCAAQNILDDCKQRMTDQLNSCAPNDWRCMCDQQINVVVCYNNCPGSAEGIPERQKQQVWCDAAKALPSSSTTAASSTSSATKTASSTSSATDTAKKASASSSSSSSSSSTTTTSTSTGAAALPTAAFGAVEGGLMLAVVLGVLGL